MDFHAEQEIFNAVFLMAACLSWSLPAFRHWSEYVVEEGVNDFPIGWEQRFTATGVMYFVDHINRTTTVS